MIAFFFLDDIALCLKWSNHPVLCCFKKLSGEGKNKNPTCSIKQNEKFCKIHVQLFLLNKCR